MERFLESKLNGAFSRVETESKGHSKTSGQGPTSNKIVMLVAFIMKKATLIKQGLDV